MHYLFQCVFVCGLFNNAAYTTSNGWMLIEEEVFYLFVVYLTMCSGSQSSEKWWDA
jgi:hypothetical protein